jgi:hypothetical protein
MTGREVGVSRPAIGQELERFLRLPGTQIGVGEGRERASFGIPLGPEERPKGPDFLFE